MNETQPEREQRHQETRLQMAVSDKILTLFDEYAGGQFDEMPRGDVQGLIEAAAMGIIAMVREAEV